ncbi:inverse autotransporter beta domain-containing protein [Salmonella enterica subsp. enterica serovar Saintpaul]|nr:inverse autotransporter beta domain-containing protein [Salmonella enterica subsp. enterica serovar Saintpaul]
MHLRLKKTAAAVCIAAQLTGGAGSVFFPLLSPARAEQHSLFSSRTALYVLKEGDTVDSVAKQFGLTTPELKTLNEFRTYSKPFDQLGAGDEVDVPAPSLKNTDTTPVAQSATTTQDKTGETFWATEASQAGSLLSSDDVATSATSMARGMATSTASTEVEKWLSQFGTARVDLSLDDDFSLDESAVDVLLPLYDTRDHLWFTQLGYRHKDERNTVNMGLGFRTFQEAWMYGINSFWDNDMTGHNRRVGFGLEAWTDYLRLAANSYTGITDWHQSRDFEDYDERPADGFDIRAEAWLPAYPQLGGKLMYEQYSGEEVALFNKDDRMSDPKVITLGLNYTPVPVVTIGVDHHQSDGSDNETEINLEFNYRMGVPLGEQLDPSAVGFARTLAGSRLDLVDRNNDVVLEYKKQDLISIGLPAQMSGDAGSTASLTAVVKSKYSVDRVEWDAAELVAAGGSITQSSEASPVVQVTYPPYNTTRSPDANKYNIKAVAYDVKGNESNRATTVVSVAEPDAGIAGGDLTVTKDNALANGADTNSVQAKVTDAGGSAAAGMTVTFTADNGGIIATSTATTGADGLATTNLTNTTSGVTTVTASVNGSSQSVDTTFKADPSTATILSGDLKMTVDGAMANGADPDTVQAKVTDANGNVVPDVTVSFSTAVSGATIVTPTVTTDSNGLATTNITSTAAGTGSVSAEVNGNRQSVQATFVPDAGSITIADADFTVASGAKANGRDNNALSATVKDVNGNVMSGANVTFTVTSGAATPTTQTVTTDATGVASATLVSLVAAGNQVTASVNGTTTAEKTSTFVADATTAVVNLTSDIVRQDADGTSPVNLSASLKDANGNVLINEKVIFTTTGNALYGMDTSTTVITDSNGVAVTDITNSIAEGVTVTATPVSNIEGAKTLDLVFFALAPIPMPSAVQIKSHGGTFAANAGFPKTGFDGAQFQFAMNGNIANNSNYTWSVESGDSWLSVNTENGTVTFNNEGSDAVILATPKDGGVPMEYVIDVRTWFINGPDNSEGPDYTDTWCAAQPGGYTTPSYTQMTDSVPPGGMGTTGIVGHLYSEWGDMFFWGWSSGISSNRWASESSDTYRYRVAFSQGNLSVGYNGAPTTVSCSKNL